MSAVWDKINRRAAAATTSRPSRSDPWPRPIPECYPLLRAAKRNRQQCVSTTFNWQDGYDAVKTNYVQIFREPVTVDLVDLLGEEAAEGLAFHRICKNIELAFELGETRRPDGTRCTGGVRYLLGRPFIPGDLLVLRELRPLVYLRYPYTHDGIVGEWLFEGGLQAHPSAAYAENERISHGHAIMAGHSTDSMRETLVSLDSLGRVIQSWNFEISGVLMAISRSGGSYSGMGSEIEHFRRRMFMDARKDYATKRIADAAYPFASRWELRTGKGTVVPFTPQEIASLLP